MLKRIQIPQVQYDLMVSYIQDHYDPDDACRYHKIMSEIEEKQMAMLRHNLYTIYKSSKEPETKETAALRLNRRNV